MSTVIDDVEGQKVLDAEESLRKAAKKGNLGMCKLAKKKGATNFGEMKILAESRDHHEIVEKAEFWLLDKQLKDQRVAARMLNDLMVDAAKMVNDKDYDEEKMIKMEMCIKMLNDIKRLEPTVNNPNE